MSPVSEGGASGKALRRVAILFAGGPAPAANAVISTAGAAFLRNGIEVVGILNGYSRLVDYHEKSPLVEGRDYVLLTRQKLRRTRNSRGIMIGTARTNPGKNVSQPADLADPQKTEQLRAVHDALSSLDVDALVSIGGDDTLKTANKFLMFQEHLDGDRRRIGVVHVPKTIDNDYYGIDFTFGYFSAVETLAGEIRNLLADAEATQSFYLVEAMGRSAGWLAYGAAIAGEASLVLSVEDLTDEYLVDEPYEDAATGESKTRKVMDLDKVVGLIIRTMDVRQRDGKNFGVVVMAEGLAEYLPARHLEGIPRDEHGHIAIAQVQFGRKFARFVSDALKREGKTDRKITPIQVGYEARCCLPNAFDVMLGSQLGVGAYRALAEEHRSGVMVSVSGQLELQYKPFRELIDPETLVTKVRRIAHGSDFYKLARFLETEIHR